jgi:hypothetical protein
MGAQSFRFGIWGIPKNSPMGCHQEKQASYFYRWLVSIQQDLCAIRSVETVKTGDDWLLWGNP